MRNNKFLLDFERLANRLIGTANALMERYARVAELVDSIPLWFERLEANQREFIEELALIRDTDAFWQKRLEQLIIADKIGDKSTSSKITNDITDEHMRDWLREKISDSQTRLVVYTRNIDHIKLQVAQQGYSTIEQKNKLDDYQHEADKLEEAIARMRKELDETNQNH